MWLRQGLNLSVGFGAPTTLPTVATALGSWVVGTGPLALVSGRGLLTWELCIYKSLENSEDLRKQKLCLL